jgi:hypothetical protein
MMSRTRGGTAPGRRRGTAPGRRRGGGHAHGHAFRQGRVAFAAALVVLLAAAPAFADLPSTWLGPAGWWPDLDGLPALSDLEGFIDALQQALERLTAWIQLFQRGSADVLSQMIAEAPGTLPDEAQIAAFLSELAALPASFQAALQAVAHKLLAPAVPGSLDALHHAYIESNQALIDQAAGIAGTDEVVAGGEAQQEAASAAATLGAAAVSRDLRPLAAAQEAAAANDVLSSAAQDLPSSRAGIELLVAAAGAGLQQQANLGAAQADRLTVLAQQTAQVSQQLSALAATEGALTLRQADADRRSLSAQLGVADAASMAGQLLEDTLAAADPDAPAPPVLQPLY